MKTTFLLTAVQNGAKRIPMGLAFAVAIFLHHDAHAISITLGTAADFAILGGQQVTFDPGTTTVTGNVGVSPGNGSLGTSITGVPANLILTGSSAIHNTDGVAAQAQLDLTTAYVTAAGAPVPLGNTIPNIILTQTLGPGVYDFVTGGTVKLDGALTLSGSGLFVFKVGADLQTAIGSSVDFLNGADACDVIWQVSSSANLLGSDFAGTILALTSITLGDGVTVDGRLLAQNGLVSLIHDTIFTDNCQPGEGSNGSNGGTGGPGGASVPDSGNMLLLLGSGLVTLFAFKRRFPTVA